MHLNINTGLKWSLGSHWVGLVCAQSGIQALYKTGNSGPVQGGEILLAYAWQYILYLYMKELNPQRLGGGGRAVPWLTIRLLN
jgi:hypothetical protein